jgi:plasmid stability protein
MISRSGGQSDTMGQVIIRNLDEAVIARLKRQAAERKQSLEQALRDILTEASRPTRSERLAEIDRIRALTPRRLRHDSTELIRAERDRR